MPKLACSISFPLAKEGGTFGTFACGTCGGKSSAGGTGGCISACSWGGGANWFLIGGGRNCLAGTNPALNGGTGTGAGGRIIGGDGSPLPATTGGLTAAFTSGAIGRNVCAILGLGTSVCLGNWGRTGRGSRTGLWITGWLTGLKGFLYKGSSFFLPFGKAWCLLLFAKPIS